MWIKTAVSCGCLQFSGRVIWSIIWTYRCWIDYLSYCELSKVQIHSQSKLLWYNSCLYSYNRKNSWCISSSKHLWQLFHEYGLLSLWGSAYTPCAAVSYSCCHLLTNKTENKGGYFFTFWRCVSCVSTFRCFPSTPLRLQSLCCVF